MSQSSPVKRRRFFIYLLLGAILGCVLGLSFRFFYDHLHNPRLFVIRFEFPFGFPHTTLILLTLAGALGGVLYAIRNKELVFPHKTEDIVNPGFLGDCFFGVAGAYVISLILPGDFPSDVTDARSVQLTIQVLATGIIGGYGGRSIIDRALDNILRRQNELEDKVEGNSKRIKQGIGQIERVNEQTQSVTQALALLERYFDEDLPTNNEGKEIKELVAKVSSSDRTFIFVEAKKVRETNMWKKPFMVERTIPVFEALLEIGSTDQFLHRYHAQLGYALQGKSKPDWLQAETELSKAIDIRDKSPDKDESFWVYEFNRSICRINLDEKPNLILDDLRIAIDPKNHTATQFKAYLAKLDEGIKNQINKWLAQNKISIDKWLTQNKISSEDVKFSEWFGKVSELNYSNESHTGEAVA